MKPRRRAPPTTEEPTGAARLRLAQIGSWQASLLALFGVTLAVVGRGSVPSLLAGGLMMFGSLFLQRFAVTAAFRRHQQPNLALFFQLLKLTLVLVFIYVGFNTTLIAPMSFAVGATTLPVAIVFDVCYLEWSTRRSRALSN